MCFSASNETKDLLEVSGWMWGRRGEGRGKEGVPAPETIYLYQYFVDIWGKNEVLGTLLFG